MKKISALKLVGILLIANCNLQAIEDLQITVQQDDVVLSWPSTAGEIYLIQYRETLSPSTPWTFLSSNHPPDTGTNRTTFIHQAVVTIPGPQGGGGGGGGGAPPSPSFAQVSGGMSADPMREQRIALLSKMKLPPVPWDSRFVLPPSPMNKSSLMLNSNNSPSPQGNSGSTGTCGFYRVVREGIHAFNIADNAILTGRELIQFEVGVDDPEPFAGVFAHTTSGPLPGMDFLSETNGFLEAGWETFQETNGTYEVVWSGSFGPEYLPVTKTNTIQIANDIWFPEGGWYVAGDALRVLVQTIHTNGSWSASIFDQDHNLISSSLLGAVDQNGILALAGDPNPAPGFSLALFNNGTPLPYTGYIVELTVNPPPPSPQGPGNQSQLVYTNWVELPKWDGHTIFAIGYMPTFGSPQGGASSQDALNLQFMIHDVYNVAEARGLGPQVVRGTHAAPFEINGPPDWAQLIIDLRVHDVRNFYYYGHGDPDFIGENNYSNQIDWFTLNQALGNFWGNTNRHPFRFAFLDGCLTANGNLPTAFGMPRKAVPLAFFQGWGIRERAFMGWSGYVLNSWITFNQQHANFVANLFSEWGEGNTIRQARDLAAGNPQGSLWANVQENLKIYGFEGLLIND